MDWMCFAMGYRIATHCAKTQGRPGPTQMMPASNDAHRAWYGKPTCTIRGEGLCGSGQNCGMPTFTDPTCHAAMLPCCHAGALLRQPMSGLCHEHTPSRLSTFPRCALRFGNLAMAAMARHGARKAAMRCATTCKSTAWMLATIPLPLTVSRGRYYHDVRWYTLYTTLLGPPATPVDPEKTRVSGGREPQPQP